jgi:hypothetical protein
MLSLLFKVKISDGGNSCAFPFTEETYLFYTKTECVPPSKHVPLRLYKTNLLILYKTEVTGLINELTDSYVFLFIKCFVLNNCFGFFYLHSLPVHLSILLFRN